MKVMIFLWILLLGICVCGLGSALPEYVVNETGTLIITNCTTLNETGAYELDGNLTNYSADCLMIGADGITIDGNGNIVNGNINGSGEGVSDVFGACGDLSSVDRATCEGNSAIWYSDAYSAKTDLTIRNLTIFGDIILVGEDVLEEVTPYYGSGGFGGNIILADSNLQGSIISRGGQGGIYDTAGSGGNVLVVYSRLNNIESSGGTGDVGGLGGAINITCSFMGNIATIGGQGGYDYGVPGSAGAVNVFNSTVGNINSIGGGAFYSTEGALGSIVTILDSNVTYVQSNGGSSDSGLGGPGGDVSIQGDNSSFGEINVLGGACTAQGCAGVGSPGSVTLNYTFFFNDSNTIYSNMTLKIIRYLVGEIDFFDNNIIGSGLTNISTNLNISNNFVFINSTSLPQLNRSANVYLYNLSTNFINPQIAGDNYICSDCYNFTSLDAGDVIFNVTHWSSYSIINATSPEVFLFSVLNSSDISRDFIFNVSDYSSVSNCSLNIFSSAGDAYSTGNYNISEINKSSNNSFTKTNFIIGDYIAYVNCTNIYGFEGQSNAVSFNVEEQLFFEEEASSSSGGSLGLLSISDYYLGRGATRTLMSGNVLRFNINNQSHSLTVNSISNVSITITVKSTPQMFTMRLEDVLYVDVNSDGVKDLEVSYLKYFTNTVSLEIKAVSIPYEVVDVTREEDVAGAENNSTGSYVNSKNGWQGSFYLWFGMILFLLFIFLLIKKYIFRRRSLRVINRRNKR